MIKITNVKLNKMNEIEKYENAILRLKDWVKGEIINLEENLGSVIVSNEEQRDNFIKLFKTNILSLKKARISDNKLYLSEIIKKEKPEFGSNNLILAPVGSGKSSLIKNILIKNVKGKILFLVSNTTLKDSVCPVNMEVRANIGHRMFTTKNKSKFGEEDYDIHVMTYAELGQLIKSNNDFIKDFVQIHCDEIHSLPEYQSFTNNVELSHAIKYLFNKHEGQQIFYFTATDENLKTLKQKQPEIMKDVKVFNYLNHPDIKRYMALSSYKINHLDQIRPHLKARLESFNYFGYKGLAFSRTIKGQKRIEQIALEEGFKPLVLWSVNNESEDLKMTEEQLNAREELLITGQIPKPYNLLVINSAMQEGWDLKDYDVTLAIMNTTNETEYVQALGRLRNDVDILVYRSKESKDVLIDLPSIYMHSFLNPKLKAQLCEELNIIDNKGRLCKWPAIKKLLIENDYNVSDKIIRENGKQVRASIIVKNKQELQ